MPQTKSARKQLRQNIQRQQRNRAVNSRLKTKMRYFSRQIESGEIESARAALKEVNSLLDRALSKGVVKKNYVSRQKSRLMTRLNEISSRQQSDVPLAPEEAT